MEVMHNKEKHNNMPTGDISIAHYYYYMYIIERVSMHVGVMVVW